MNEIKRTKFNIILLGETLVGKTSMIAYLTNGRFEDVGLSTAGIDCHLVETQFEGKKYKFKIFDTAGQERYRSISKSSIKLADGFLLVFAVDNKNTFNKLNGWVESIQNEVDLSQKIIFLVGNKCDITDKREITSEAGSDFGNKNKMKYFETSAKTGSGINEVFNELYKEIYNLNKKSTNSNINLDNNKHEQKKNCC